MSNILEKKNILKCLKETINDCKSNTIVDIKNAKYHHNTPYDLAPSIIKNGILSLEELNKQKINSHSKAFLDLMSDDDLHINGVKGVSLAVMGLIDLYKDEDEYNSYDCRNIDFLISNDIKAIRKTENYGNEYICYSSIMQDKIKSIDVRIIKYINLLEQNKNTKDMNINKLLNEYNYLKKIVQTLNEVGLDLPLREMSDDKEILLDKNKILTLPKIYIK